MAELTPDELQALIDKLDDVCHEAKDLQQTLRQNMVERARNEQQDRHGQPERRKRQR